MKIPFGYLYKRSGGKRFSARSTRAGTFYYSNPGPDGKDRPVSLQTTDRDAAELRAVEMCGRIRLTDEQEWLKSLERLGAWARERLDTSGRQSVLFDEVWATYKASKRRPPSGESTLKHYGVIWKAFYDWRLTVVDCRANPLDGLDAATCEKYVDQLEAGLKESSVKKHLSVLKLIFRIVCPEAVNPWDGLRVMKVSRTEKKRALDPDEVRSVIAGAMQFKVFDERYHPPKVISVQGLGKELAGLHLVGYWTGLRLTDAVHLSGGQIDRKVWVIRIVPQKTGRRKPEPLEIPISAELREWLEENAKASGPVFPELVKVYDQLGAARICQWVDEIWTKAGVVDDERGTASFHSLRVTFQSLNDAAGTSRVFTRSVTGHSSSKMSDTYSRSNVEKVREAVGKALPKVMNAE